MTMDKKDRRSEQIKVMVTGAELMELARQAGSEPLSSYCRRVLFEKFEESQPHRDLVQADIINEQNPSITSEQIQTAAEELEKLKTPKRKKREPKKCPHGEPEGNNCWRCGGLAKIA